MEGPGHVYIFFNGRHFPVAEFPSQIGGAKLTAVPTAVPGGSDQQGMVAAFAGGADGAHLKEKVIPRGGRQEFIKTGLRNHGLMFSGTPESKDCRRFPKERGGELPGDASVTALIALAIIISKGAGGGENFFPHPN